MNLLIFLIITAKNVKIIYKPLFESDFLLYRIAEKISFKPKKFRIKSFLIEDRDTVIISESIRRLRETGVFTEIEFFKKEDTLIIKLRQLFTLALFFNFEGGGGLVQKGIGIWDHNFLGLLLDARLNYIWGYEYPYLYFQSFYPSIFKNHDISIFYLDSKFSKIKNISIFPFFSSYVKNKLNLYYTEYKTKRFFYEKGIILDTFEFKGKDFLFEFSKNFLRKDLFFSPLIGFGDRGIDKSNYYLSLGFETGKLKTETVKFIRNFGEKEYNLQGIFLRLNLYKNIVKEKTGYETKLFINFFESKLSSINYLTLKDFLDKFFNLQSFLYLKINNSIILAFMFRYEKIKEIFNDFNFRYLGGLYGLRGYKAFYFFTSHYILNISEIRIYFKEFLELFKPGVVFFIDNSYMFDRKNFSFSYGFGIRIEITKTYDLPVMRMDIGFSEKGKYLSFGEGQSF
ncbi:MAG: hypothetical protein ABIM78_01325 [candidate division WOR-3 bacterium]